MKRFMLEVTMDSGRVYKSDGVFEDETSELYSDALNHLEDVKSLRMPTMGGIISIYPSKIEAIEVKEI